ncbi:ATP-dependent zinc metalloprotease FtsH [Jatrophihabitans telluris]|uniref:ATP-dependent zinc metalloprotease FtsH n=1 Tax=Jatrophihabitans telluris TaxID=2038343 RepID=UPI0024C09D14|nr:ATP-dependent zinc metalloprotease FtsH [Jatrophihabitans telluris]
MDRKRLVRSPLIWVVAAVILVLVLPTVLRGGSSYKSVKTSDAIAQITSGNVKSATVHDKESSVDLDLKTAFQGKTKISASYPSDFTQTLTTDLLKSEGATFTTKQSKDNIFVTLLINFLPLILIGLVLFFVMSNLQGGGSKVMSFGRSKAKLVSKDTPKTTFSDVAGADEAIEELQEIKEFLANPARFQAIGAKIPKGVLLYGPPGTGKTLLARAVAGEAGVPFYSISGSDFVEMFVGVGASRVRDLFEQAKANAPAIVFVDEIDAVGRHRGAGMGGGHDEREQTLNQLLVEMDGFDVKGTVILIAATNRPDILDPALLRPGRFDRQIAVSPPDIIGRKAVLEVHAKGKPFAPDVNLDNVARRTPGFTGADLANVINEAALLTARYHGRLITDAALEEAIDRVIAGPERKTRAMSDKEKRVTAYHEAGHALAAWAMPNLDPVHKVTILPRGRSLGHTLVLPLEDRYQQTRAEILDQLVYALGGRAAEELVFHEPTTGASNDIEKATSLARSMVTEYGMSSRLGAVKYGTSDSEPFLGRDYGHQRDYSEEIASWIDEEVRGLIEGAHDEAWEILVQYRDVLDAMVLELAEKETLSKDELERILAPVRKRPPHNTFAGFGKRTPSDRPPIEIPHTVRVQVPSAYANSGSTNGAANRFPGSGGEVPAHAPYGEVPYGSGQPAEPASMPGGMAYPPAPGQNAVPAEYPPPPSDYPPPGQAYLPAGQYSPPPVNGYPPVNGGHPDAGYQNPPVNGYPPAYYPQSPGYPPPESYPPVPGFPAPEEPASHPTQALPAVPDESHGDSGTGDRA